ncbi:MAG TPA: phosphotransferase [Coxiellaceae bacterium]|nr:phosphotransferase [Coxiellaceae bacterium]
MRFDIVSDARLNDALQWIHQNGFSIERVEPITGDASTRRYFRLFQADQPWVLMDMPDEPEAFAAFVAIAKELHQHHLQVPAIIASSPEKGFALLSDLGNDLLQNALSADNADTLYRTAMDDLVRLDTIPSIPNHTLPPFGEKRYRDEMNLFIQWYLQTHLNYSPTEQESALLSTLFDQLIASANSQVQVCVHRDYHSRNLLRLPNNSVGILDFQDAVIGPITYDVMSLLRDCYIDWPESNIYTWLRYFYEKLLANYVLPSTVDFKTFERWFDWATLQRNLKCIGLFPRLKYRDHKLNYMQYLPRIFNYALYVTDKYPEWHDVKRFLEKVRP